MAEAAEVVEGHHRCLKALAVEVEDPVIWLALAEAEAVLHSKLEVGAAVVVLSVCPVLVELAARDALQLGMEHAVSLVEAVEVVQQRAAQSERSSKSLVLVAAEAHHAGELCNCRDRNPRSGALVVEAGLSFVPVEAGARGPDLVVLACDHL